jgi:hypothetical protein
MLDAARATALLNRIMAGYADPAWPSAWTLRLMTAPGTNAANGNEATAVKPADVILNIRYASQMKVVQIL